MQVQPKSPGKFYAVVLRGPGLSLARTAAKGAVGGTAEFPVPDLGTRCICCDTDDAARVEFDASTDRYRVPPIPIPLCEACRSHVPLSTSLAQILGVGLAMSGGAVLYGLSASIPAIAIAGGGATAVAAAILLVRQRKRSKLAAEGHQCGLEIMVSPAQCSVRTTNVRVARELVQRHREQLHRVR